MEEDNKIVKKGYIWMLKAGRKLIENKINKVKDESAILALKSPKAVGGEYYYASIYDYRYGNQINIYESPACYKNLVDDENFGK